MNEPVPTRPTDSWTSRALPVRELALLTLVLVLVSGVSFGLGYVTGRDRVGFVHDDRDVSGIDAELAGDDLVELLARIEVSDAADQGLSELRYPDELRGRPQDRPASGLHYAIDLGSVPAARVEDLRTVLHGRRIPAYLSTDQGTSHVLVGGFTSPAEADSWLPILEDAVVGLGLATPKVVVRER